jgi:hypothetical protein
MSKFLGFVMFGAAIAFTSTAASAADFSGRWATKTSGEMRLEQSGDRVNGTYALNGGQIRGEVSGDRLSGTWAQSTSGRRCSRQELGTNYWGRLSVRLSGDARSWSGRWSYCDEAEGSGGEWNGERIGGVMGGYHDGPAATTTFEGRWATKTSGEMRLAQNGDHVDGSYALSGGQIRGDSNGNRLSGIWAQSTSGRRCGRQELGTDYWGRFSFQLSTDGERWSGRWSYCDEAEGSGGEWNGSRIGE